MAHGPRLHRSPPHQRVEDSTERIHHGRQIEGPEPLLPTAVRGHCADEVGGEEARYGAEALGDAEQRAGVGRGDVAVVDEEAGEVEPAESHGQGEEGHRLRPLRARHEARGDEEGGGPQHTRQGHALPGPLHGQDLLADEAVGQGAPHPDQEPEEEVRQHGDDAVTQ